VSVDPQGSYESARRCAERATRTRSPELRASLIDLSRTYLARALELERSLALWAGILRVHESTPSWPSIGNLRIRLEQANRRVAECELLVVGWREVIEAQQRDGRDLEMALDLLKSFENGLEEAISSKEAAQDALDQRLVDIFEGLKGRRPQHDQELHDWLASPEGKAATAFEPTSGSRWGAGRS
jgi:hypothetical protein